MGRMRLFVVEVEGDEECRNVLQQIGAFINGGERPKPALPSAPEETASEAVHRTLTRQGPRPVKTVDDSPKQKPIAERGRIMCHSCGDEPDHKDFRKKCAKCGAKAWEEIADPGAALKAAERANNS